jgi:steroid delta-isomerase-like uncharacterized protein
VSPARRRSAAKEERMTLEDNKALVRRFVDEIFIHGRPESVDELLADDFVPHTWPSTGHPKDDLKAAIGRVGKALEDSHFTIDDMIAEGDRVAVRLTSGATQVGVFMGLPPSGKSYEIEEIHIFRIRDGKVVEHWHQLDQMGLMRQLGGQTGGPTIGSEAGSANGSGRAADSESAAAIPRR